MVKPDIANWPIGTKIYYSDGVVGIIQESGNDLSIPSLNGKSIWLISDGVGAWDTWAFGYFTAIGQSGFKIKKIKRPGDPNYDEN